MRFFNILRRKSSGEKERDKYAEWAKDQLESAKRWEKKGDSPKLKGMLHRSEYKRNASACFSEAAKLYFRIGDLDKAQNAAMNSRNSAAREYDIKREFYKTTGEQSGERESYLAINNLLAEIDKRKKNPARSIDSVATSVITIFSIFAGFFLITSSSNKVQLSPGADSIFSYQLWIGVGLIIVGILAGWLYFKKK